MTTPISPDGKISILLVDDRPEGLMTLEAVLSSPEYHLVKASSGEEALRCLLDEDFALILLDVQMPGMNGFETARLIRKRTRSRHVPIIFITAINKDDQYVGRGYELGAVDYLFKPVDPGILKSKVSVFVDLYRKTDQIRRQSEMLRLNEVRERERQLAQLELESLKRYRNLADSIPNIVWKGHAGAIIDYFNRSWTDYTGLELEKSVGSGWKAALHPECVQLLEANWKKAIEADENSFEMEIRIRRASDGQFRWHLLRVFAERSRSGEVDYWLATNTEIHDRREAEQERQRLLERERAARSEAERLATRFSQLAELIPEFVGEFNDSLGWVNGRWEEYTGIPSEKLLGKGWLDAVHPDDVQRVIEAWDQALRSDEPFTVQYRMRSKGGEYRWFLARALPCPNEDGSTRWVGVATDIQIFRDLDEQRANFLSIASHELKTPLTSIKTTLQLRKRALTQGTRLENDVEKRLVEIGIKSATRLNNLLDDLLDYSRVESGRLTIDPQPGDLAETVRDSVASCRDEIEATGRLQLVSELPERLEGHWDTVRLRQVVDNLIGNAVKYSPTAGVIEVRLRKEADQAVLSVRDQGIGISSADQERIFGAFERAVDHKNYGGFGIGLYVSNRIVEQHHGKLEVESESGKGSTFTIRLPISEVREEAGECRSARDTYSAEARL